MALALNASTITFLNTFANIGAYALPIFVALRGFSKGQNYEACSLGAAAGVQKLSISFLKNFFPNPRPFPNHCKVDSFPSGHTAGGFLAVGYTLAAALLDPNESSLLFKICITAFAVLIGISRYLTNMHHPIDILVGAGLGIFFGGASVLVPHLMGKSSINQSVKA